MHRDFDLSALFEAVDGRREDHNLTWPALARAIWQQSSDLNERRGDHPISTATIRNLSKGRGLSCQHALFVLRWLESPPETFVGDPYPDTKDVPLPATDTHHRLRWNLKKLHGALDAARLARKATWQQAAERLRCSPNQLTGLRTAKFATNMVLAMRVTQALRRPAADFIYAAEW